MNSSYTENQEFIHQSFTAEKLPRGEYETCTFTDCDFNGTDLSGVPLWIANSKSAISPSPNSPTPRSKMSGSFGAKW
ncbi:hypothetical protein [Salmonirosea aquatica]|uniref:hypothetical protein n=1 Tax=Salmonirosea aquatica TaxID=2654236 RepID=UPI003570FD82